MSESEKQPSRPSVEPEWPRDFAVDAPPHLLTLARQAVEDGHRHLVPPLKREDIIFIVGTSLAAKHLYRQAPHEDGEPPPYAHMVLLDVLGVLLTVMANRDYAALAGFLYVSDPQALEDQVVRRLHQWHEEVLDPALGGPWCPNPDVSPRAKALKAQHGDYFRLFFRPNYARTLKNLERAVIDNAGGNEWSAVDRESMPKDRATVIGWFKIVAESAGLLGTPFELIGGEMSLNSPRATAALDEHLGAAERLKEQPSLDRPTSRGSPRRSLLQSHQPTGADLAALAELRDLRDELDLQRQHPHLNELVEDQLRVPHGAGDATAWLRKVAERLNRIQDRALLAAVVYEIGGLGADGHPRWTRAALAEHYAVSPRMIEARSSQATEILAQLRAA